ncbi:acyltransferase [Pedobacter petrophilus]|uniref:Acyltransferase n=1 Tax=Pedobacter petrophilus TaxID=1908241 RepID=A0A7K0G317_9SPHI|nr:acyltransferase [Pedobacter petrophilus]MRX78205.1 acyltransferase [Pedobacter petrophilus]
MGFKIIWFIKTMFWRLIVGRIGILSYFSDPVFLFGAKRIFIGNRVRIFPQARLETHFKGEIIFEDNISIGQNLHIVSSHEKLVIGKNTTFSANVFVTNVDHEYSELNIHILKQKYLVKTTKIGENSFLGYGVVIQAGTILGKHCIVGSNAVVRGVFPDYCVIVGSPARIVKRYNHDSKLWQRTDSDGQFLNYKE